LSPGALGISFLTRRDWWEKISAILHDGTGPEGCAHYSFSAGSGWLCMSDEDCSVSVMLLELGRCTLGRTILTMAMNKCRFILRLMIRIGNCPFMDRTNKPGLQFTSTNRAMHEEEHDGCMPTFSNAKTEPGHTVNHGRLNAQQPAITGSQLDGYDTMQTVHMLQDTPLNKLGSRLNVSDAEVL